MQFSKSTLGFYIVGFHTAIPADAVDIADDEHSSLMAAQAQGKQIVADDNGYPIAVERAAPTPAERMQALTDHVQEHLNTQARRMGYDDLKTAVGYADEPAVPKFQAEGRSLRAWRSLVWAKCYSVMAEVESGHMPEPSAETLVAMLPPFSMLP